jgi:hypothetical protein
MASEKFFSKFPIITYSNNQVVDITRRVTLLDKISSDPYVFYPYEIDSYERADQLSERYYGDSYMSWLLYLSNKITDPYYEWYMHDNEFEEFIIKKYNSTQNAKTKIKYYRNDWANNTVINVSGFNALTAGQMNYWEPDVNDNTRNILYYKRKEKDWVVTTNKIMSYSVSNTDFIVDEICTIYFDKQHIGQGQVYAASNNIVYLQHVSGYYDNSVEAIITSNSYIYGQESKTNTVFTTATWISNNIPDDVLSYWKPVTFYDYENEKNEFNKTIRVVDSNLQRTAVQNLKDLLES